VNGYTPVLNASIEQTVWVREALRRNAWFITRRQLFISRSAQDMSAWCACIRTAHTPSDSRINTARGINMIAAHGQPSYHATFRKH
jgi:hypothetical protein